MKILCLFVPTLLAGTLLAGGLAMACICTSAAAATPRNVKPERVTLGGIIHPATNDTPAFTPDGTTVFFDRRQDHHATILVSHNVDGHWSKPEIASFSGRWNDQDPAVAPDGSYVVFCSNRPVSTSGRPVTYPYHGKAYPGANLWKVARAGDHWGKPVWLGPVVNDSVHIYAPSVAADGTLYFIKHGTDDIMHIFRSRRRDGHYLPPTRVKLGDSGAPTHDPSIAPDQSFIVFDYGKLQGGLGRLSIAFREGDHWSLPIDLGDAANALKPWGNHLAPGAHSVYFTGNDGVYRLSLRPWLRQSHADGTAADAK